MYLQKLGRRNVVFIKRNDPFEAYFLRIHEEVYEGEKQTNQAITELKKMIKKLTKKEKTMIIVIKLFYEA